MVVQVMGTETSRKARAAFLALAAAIAGGCSGSSHPPASRSTPFSWLRPATRPTGWSTVTIHSGGSIPFPPSWKRIPGDRGTATAALLGGRGAFLGYLNLTPRQGDETLSNWVSFRVEHNAEEGDRHVTTLATTIARQLDNQRWSCVEDTYTTTTGRRYIEFACLVTNSRSGIVVVGASPPTSWPRISPLLERAIDGVRA
jgi:hypothetical protein